MADCLTPAQRSYCMSRIRAFDSGPEIAIHLALRQRRLRYKRNVQSMPGRPDFVFTRARLIVFVDGSFWHGYRYPKWAGRLTPFWKAKIERNRARDLRNHRRHRSHGWRVIRIWDHQVARDLNGCVERITGALRAREAWRFGA
jgi:DNA mismatch endonuclease (patch repair protein)